MGILTDSYSFLNFIVLSTFSKSSPAFAVPLTVLAPIDAYYFFLLRISTSIVPFASFIE